MKKNLYKLYFLTFFLLVDFVAFAQPGDDDENGDNGDMEGGDTPPTPINGKLIWLMILGIIFAYYAYKRSRKTA